MRDLLLVFLKWPEPGRAKTRLISALGPEKAAGLYRALAEEEVRRTAPLAGEYERLFCFAPPDARAKVAAWFPGEDLWPQPEGDLGARMAAAFDEGFARGARCVAIIGTDVPWVSRETVAGALRALGDADVVLGPAADGGYYLLALKRPEPKLFEGISWSTAGVLTATRERAAALGLETLLLEPMRDIDSVEDLRAEWDRLGPILERDPRLRSAIAGALR